MSNEQLIVILLTASIVMITFAPTVILAPIKGCSTDQQILKWAGIIFIVMAGACAYLYIEVLDLTKQLI